MQKQEGQYTLAGAVATPPNHMEKMAGMPMRISPTGTAYLVGLWRCSSCGFIELVDGA